MSNAETSVIHLNFLLALRGNRKFIFWLLCAFALLSTRTDIPLVQMIGLPLICRHSAGNDAYYTLAVLLSLVCHSERAEMISGRHQRLLRHSRKSNHELGLRNHRQHANGKIRLWQRCLSVNRIATREVEMLGCYCELKELLGDKR
jgi:hypothetical protein